MQPFYAQEKLILKWVNVLTPLKIPQKDFRLLCGPDGHRSSLFGLRLPADIKNCTSNDTFRKKLKKHIFTTITTLTPYP
jgi:hypothetical protein